MDNKSVSILITWDVDPDRWATNEQRQIAISQAIDLCQDLNIRSTFFITANFAHEYPDPIKRLHLFGHEIGCHGLNHTDEEDYNRMPLELQRKYIEAATQKIQTVIGSTVSSFRSPRVKTSASTLQLLSEYNYQADSSVCSQRLDLVSSNLINLNWLTAPRKPYHPHPRSAFKRGNMPVWEVPISAAFVPFISSALKVLGVGWMKILSWLLYTEARITGKPIVYLAHPTEFIASNHRKTHPSLQDLSLHHIQTHGFLARNRLFRLKGPVLLNATRELFAYLSSLPHVNFLTCNEYISHLNRSPKSL